MKQIIIGVVLLAAGAAIETLIRLSSEILRRGRARCSELAEEARAILEDIEPEGRDEVLALYRANESLENLRAILEQGETRKSLHHEGTKEIEA